MLRSSSCIQRGAQKFRVHVGFCLVSSNLSLPYNFYLVQSFVNSLEGSQVWADEPFRPGPGKEIWDHFCKGVIFHVSYRMP